MYLICIYIHIYVHTRVQDYVMALMMGTHARLGAHSRVLLLDRDVVVSIAHMIIADRW